MDKIEEIIIHCSATPNGRDDRASDIHQWHKARKWSGIGYHYVVEISGKIVKGRPDYWQGAHASGHNKNSLGICLIGTDEFNSEQWFNFENLVRELIINHPKAKIIGHNEISDKTCPGFDVQEWLNRRLNTYG